MIKLCNLLMNQCIACGVFILPARPTGFAAGTLQFIKRCSRSWIHPDKATGLSHETIGTRTISSHDAQLILILFRELTVRNALLYSEPALAG